MIPPVLGRVLGLHPRILNGEQIRENASLIHADPEELRAALAASRAQLLACRRHGLVLTLQLEFLLSTQLRLIEIPGTVDGPMAQVARSRELEGSGGARVVEEVSNQGLQLSIRSTSFCERNSGLTNSFIDLLHSILSFLECRGC